MKNILIVGLYSVEACPIFSLEMAKGFKKNDYNVFAILPDDICNKKDWLIEFTGEKLFFVSLGKGKNNIIKKLKKYTNILHFLIQSGPELKQKFKNVKFDITIYTFFHRWNMIVKKYIKTTQNILILHDPLPHSDESSNRIINQKKQVQKMDKIIILSKKFKTVVKDVYNVEEKNIIYMPHGNFGYNKYRIGENKFVNNNKINFLFFGRITSYKGLNVLLKAYYLLEQKYDNIELVIAGSGDFSDYIANYSKLKKAKLYNEYIHENEIDLFFKKSNTVVVLPYLDATQSGVIAIAIEYGIPVIASNTGGLYEQLDYGNMGIYCNPGDEYDLFEKMELIINDNNLYNLESEKMKKYSEKLEWCNIIKKLMNDLIA